MRPCLLLACLLFAACAQRVPVETELRVIRGYGWPASVVDPAPDWSPTSSMVVARSLGGFSLLEEGGRGERQYAAEDRRETFFPRWIAADSFAFGPGHNALRTVEGRVVAPSDGITLVTIGEGRPLRRLISDRGFMPKPGANGLLWAQAEERIISIDPENEHGVSDFLDGFDPEPQRDGPGLCYRDTPAFSPDWWTGRGGPGTMFVRWQANRVDQVAGAMQAAWTHAGGVILTVLDAIPPAERPWWSGGTRLVELSGPGAKPTELRRNARDPAPHPLAELLAWVDGNGAVWIGTIRPGGWQERIAVNGGGPRWSPDGLRLLWLEPVAGRQQPDIRVAVLGPKR